MKRVLAALIAAGLITANVYAEDMTNMSNQAQADLAGEYISEIVKYIRENYIGEDVDTNVLIHAAVKAMVGQLDEYSDYLTKEEYNDVKNNTRYSWYAPEFSCEIGEEGYPIVGKLDPKSRAFQDGIREGDAIRSIDGVSTYNIDEEEYFERTSSSTPTEIKMGISRGESVTNYTINLVRYEIHSVETKEISEFENANQKFNDKSVGYIHISSFYDYTSNEFTSAINKLKEEGKTKLILDLRGNSGGYVDEAIEVAKQIVPSGTIISTRDKKGAVNTYTSDLRTRPFEKCVVLVDSMTASSAEILASAMQDSGAGTIIGEKTFGKGVMQSVMDFDDIGVIKMTTLEYFSRYGKKINGVGITPDIEVSKIDFVSETDALDSDNVAAVIRFLGFRLDSVNTVERNIGRYQVEMGLPVTYKLDAATVNAMNYEIYEDMINNDRIFTMGYINLLS